VNDIISLLGLEAWKPVVTALVLPPVPLLLLVLVGTRLVLSRRGLGWLLVLLATIALWLSACTGVAELLSRTVFRAPPALSPAQIAQLRIDAKARPGTMAIVVLGGGRDLLAPEYGSADLRARSLERLRYGLWLQRETGVPVAFSGGVGWGAASGTAEADIAERIAAREFGVPLKWTENDSRDTRENALRSVPLLERNGVRRIVLVTHGWHMQRALAQFEAAAAGRVEIVPASIGMARLAHGRVVDWLPTPEGFAAVNVLLREALGRLVARGG
jgi:uncharacterized SAM-binding protein YcdF (DUF218 family)